MDGALLFVCLLNALAIPTPVSPGSFFNMCFPSIKQGWLS